MINLLCKIYQLLMVARSILSLVGWLWTIWLGYLLWHFWGVIGCILIPVLPTLYLVWKTCSWDGTYFEFSSFALLVFVLIGVTILGGIVGALASWLEASKPRGSQSLASLSIPECTVDPQLIREAFDPRTELIPDDKRFMPPGYQQDRNQSL